MGTLVTIALIGLAALFVAWIANTLVGLLSGERPRDTGRLWSNIVLRIFTIKEFGVVGRILNYVASEGWPLRVLYGLGAIGILALLIRSCRD
jgi:hypothetical protein